MGVAGQWAECGCHMGVAGVPYGNYGPNLVSRSKGTLANVQSKLLPLEMGKIRHRSVK